MKERKEKKEEKENYDCNAIFVCGLSPRLVGLAGSFLEAGVLRISGV